MYIDVQAWIQLQWTDTRLSWDPELYGVREIALSQDLIWKPDIVLHNSGDGGILECKMKLGSWVYNIQQFDLQCESGGDAAVISFYGQNPTWEILNSTATRNVLYHQCCPEGYADITYTFRFRERQH
ncbi:neuronal acetylcholine receptor subunit alpha-10-like [Gigantopelta aegis]|uniref:neuronal acetylcholine receptor subunit alpha-10-like n=1 Tax=Gigantopelta aegis TaxID=1735272 RepID=UPI001B889C13|nr:neuronal acetylcholine receptor subunit alpha-10-like [Gigantopelta aegis]